MLCSVVIVIIVSLSSFKTAGNWYGLSIDKRRDGRFHVVERFGFEFPAS